MSIHLQEFERLLYDPQFWDGDIFMTTEELAPLLDADDWVALSSSWDEKSEQFKENFYVSLGNTTHPGLVDLALGLLNGSNPDRVAEGLAVLGSAAPGVGRHILDSGIETLAKVWREQPNKRLFIQQMLWAQGKSGELRRLLSLERWSEPTT